jgi:hypothetical protein
MISPLAVGLDIVKGGYMRSLGFSTVATILLVTLLLFPALTFAQETTGSLEGRLLDSKGKPVGYAYVIVTGPSIQGKRGTVTTLDGRFVVLALPVGECDVKFAHVSYVEQAFEAVRIRLGQRTSLGDVALEDKVYETQGVTVTGKAPPPLIDPTSTRIGGTLEMEDYEALPIERDYRSVAMLLPQVNQSYLGDPENFAGATGLENRYFIDGIDVSDSYRGALSIKLPYNFIQEVQVRTGGYEAEYRSSLGGTVNVVTYSGSNRVAGQAFGFFTNNTLTATPRSVPDSPNTGDFERWDVGFGVGGPIQKDRLWYYAAYNPTFQSEDVEIPEFGFYDDHLTTHSFAGKLTWRASDKNTLTLTGVGDPAQGRAVTPPLIPPANVDPFLHEVRSGGVGLMLEGRHLISDNFFIKTSISWLQRDDESLPATERGTELEFTDSTGLVSGGVFETIDDVNTVAMAGLSCTWLTGNHELKVGVEYKDTRLESNRTGKGLKEYHWNHYFMGDVAFRGEVGNRIPSAFLQDSWNMTDRLYLNAGIRWDGQFLISSEGEVAQKILDQWQPRFGITYQLGRPGTQKLFASFGRYYQELMTTGPMWYYNKNQKFLLIDWDHDPRFNPAGGDTTGYLLAEIQPENEDLEGQYFDEFTLGYERQIGTSARVGIRGVYRTLRQGIEDCMDPDTDAFIWGNPGSGELSAFPKMERDYSALELTYQQRILDGLSVLASYVLSRTYGNYAGLFDSEYGNPYPNAGGVFDTVEGLVDGEGHLPNDRTHVFKLSGSYRLPAGVTLGATGSWESGTPLNEFGSHPLGYPWLVFLQQRGTAGRTSSIWDLSLRITYEPLIFASKRWHPRLTADFLHIGSERTAVNYDQIHYNNVDGDGNQIDPSPTYGRATAYQPPMVVRLGLEMAF